MAVVGASRRACEDGCSHQGPGTAAVGDRGSCPGGGRCVMKGPRRGLQSPRPGLTSLRGPGCPVLAVVGASRRAREGGCSYQGPGTAAGGDMGSCPGGGRCVMKGPRQGLQCPRPRHTSLRGQGIVPKQWSLRPQGPARGVAVSKAPANQPGGTGGPTLVVVGASGRACEGGCSHQGPGTLASGDRESCPGTGRCILKGLRGGLQSSRPAHTSLRAHGLLPWWWSVCPEGLARGAAVIKARAHQPEGERNLAQAVVVVS